MDLKKYVAKKVVKSTINKIPERIDKRNQKIDKQNKANSLSSELQNTVNDDLTEKQQVNKLVVTFRSSKLFSSEETYLVQDSSNITRFTAKITKNSRKSNGSKIILYDTKEDEVGWSEEDDSKYLFIIYSKDWGAISFEKKMGRSSKYEISEDSWGYDANPGFLKVYDDHGDAIFQIQCSISDDSEKAIIEYTEKKYEVIATLIGLSMYTIQH